MTASLVICCCWTMSAAPECDQNRLAVVQIQVCQRCKCGDAVNNIIAGAHVVCAGQNKRQALCCFGTRARITFIACDSNHQQPGKCLHGGTAAVVYLLCGGQLLPALGLLCLRRTPGHKALLLRVPCITRKEILLVCIDLAQMVGSATQSGSMKLWLRLLKME